MKAKKICSILLTAALAMSLLAGCGGKGDTKEPDGGKQNEAGDTNQGDDTKEPDSGEEGDTTGEVIKIEIPTYRAGEDAGAPFFAGQVERFNQKYAGVYEVEIVHSGGSEEHNEKIKQLGLQGALPPVFQFSDFTYAQSNFFKEGVLYDMSQWLDSKPELKGIFMPDGMDYVTQEDGSIYAIPLAIVRPTGIYYNTQSFTPSKNIRDMTWDELIAEMKEQGALYGFQTAEQAWTLNLTTAAIMGSLEGGNEILQSGLKEKIADFSAPQWVETFTIMKKLYDAAGWTDGLGKTYPDTENAFVNNVVSVLPNGQWVINVLAEDSTNWGEGYDGSKVRGDIFPGNVAQANPCVYDWYISGTATEDEQELAKAFIEFISSQEELEAMAMAEGGMVPMTTPTAEFTEAVAANPLMNDFSTIPNAETTYVPAMHEIVSGAVMDALEANLPTFLQGGMSAEEFCQALTTAATE